MSEFLNWWRCYGVAYSTPPPNIGSPVCDVQNSLEKIENEFNKILIRSLPPPFNEIAEKILGLKSKVKAEIRNAANDAALHFAKLAAPDAATADFIDLLVKPENATRQKLDIVFQDTSNAGNKALLSFDNVAELIDSDLGLESGGAIDPRRFNALRNAITLSKLALMDTPAIRGLIWVLNGPPESYRGASPNHGVRTSMLFETVRSIDGNHQWQRYGYPYARSFGMPVPDNPEDREFGYPGDGRKGFELFNRPDLRQAVFLKLFQGPVGGMINKYLLDNDPGLWGRKYPFIECKANPFPATVNDLGLPVDNDYRCTPENPFGKIKPKPIPMQKPPPGAIPAPIPMPGPKPWPGPGPLPGPKPGGGPLGQAFSGKTSKASAATPPEGAPMFKRALNRLNLNPYANCWPSFCSDESKTD